MASHPLRTWSTHRTRITMEMQSTGQLAAIRAAAMRVPSSRVYHANAAAVAARKFLL